jgi:hypothetical protein
MRQTVIAVTVLTAVLFAAQAFALEVTYHPTPGDLEDLPHANYYKWGIDLSAFAGLNIYEVELKLISISNWDANENHLYLHLLDDAPLGVTKLNDSDNDFIDAFAGLGPLIDDYQDMNGPSLHETLVYKFSTIDALIDSVNVYRGNNVIAVGLDPDCHFYNCGIELTVKGEPTNAVETTSWGQLKAQFQH